MRASTLISSVATLAIASVGAQIAEQCPVSDLCYSLNIPDATAASGSGDIFFQIRAPSSYQWIGLGQGTQMAGANMFLLYADASGQNVTLSPRLGRGEFEPEHDTAAQITLLEGTGIDGDVMTANVRCSNCHDWDGGSMDFAGARTSWIYAYRTGSALDTDALDADLSVHDSYGSLTYQRATAQGGDSLNPFSAAASSSNGIVTTTTEASGSSSGPFGGNVSRGQAITTAHGVMASLAFVVFFPVGAILVRLLGSRHTVWIHAGVQGLGLILFIVAFALGVYMANELNYLSSHHPIIGIVLFAIVLVQPILGQTHHWLYQKYHRRFIWTHAHLWLGRIAIVLGIINGGLGLRLAGDASMGERAAYGVFAGLFGLAYIVSAVWGEMRRTKRVEGPVARGDEPVTTGSQEKINNGAEMNKI